MHSDILAARNLLSGAQAPRILISRLSAVGDCILTMPVACALRDRFPKAFIAWVAEPAAASLLKGHPCLDHIQIVPKGWLRSPKQLAMLRRQLRHLRFDVTVDPQSLSKSAIACWLSGARQRIGFAPPQGRELATWLNRIQIPRTASHVVDAYLQLLVPLGVSSPVVGFEVPDDPGAREVVEPLLRKRVPQGELVVLNPGAGWFSKTWPADRYAEVARYLGQKFGLTSMVVWSGGQERLWAESIVSASGGHAVLAPPTTLPQLAVVLRTARLFVGSDTGPLHLAAAVGTPCVGLYGPTCPADCGPYGSQHVTLQGEHPSSQPRPRKSTRNPQMQAIDAASVCEACRQVLSRVPSASVA